MARTIPHKGWWMLFGVLLLGTLGALWIGQRFGEEDARHARFYEMGSSINVFLGSYCEAFEQAQRENSIAPLRAFYAEDFATPKRGLWVFRGKPLWEWPVRVARVVRHGEEDGDRRHVFSQLKGYLDGFTGIDKSVCKINLIEEAEPPSRAVLTMKWVIDGWSLYGERMQDRRFLRWTVVRRPGEEGLEWQIVREELVDGVRVAGSGEAFESVEPTSVGLDYHHQRDPKLDPMQNALRFGVIQHAFGGVAANDVDGDGWVDLFFADGVHSRLYQHQGLDGDGRPYFEDRTEASGLGRIDQAHSALFLDFDNDGDRDLVVGRYLASSQVYENLGAAEGFVTFEDRSSGSGLEGVEPTTSMTALDFDRDGDLDLYLGSYGNAFEAVPRLPFFARNGGANRLLRNDGDLRFTDVTAESGTGDTGWTLAVAAGDVDGDGWMDLGVANDFGRKSLYTNRGDGTFEEVAQTAGVLDFSGGMGLAFGDYDGDGHLDLYTSNINSNQRWFGEDVTVHQYLRNVLRTRWAVLDAREFLALNRLVGSRWTELGYQIGEGNSLFRNQVGEGLTFEEQHDSGTARAGWSWSVAFFDFDNDADLDLYATNGWISQTPGTDL